MNANISGVMKPGDETSKKKIPKKLGIKPPCDPAIPILGIYPEETRTEKYTHPSVFTAALFNSRDAEAT